jgi:HSP20 family protein
MSQVTNKNRLREFLPGHWGELDTFVEQLLGSSAAAAATGGYRAPASLWEDENAFHLEVDVPGVPRDAIELTFEKGTLQVSIERPVADENRKYLVNERRQGKVTRTVSLPETVDGEQIEAQVIDGVLHVSIAKKPEAQPRRIEIQG